MSALSARQFAALSLVAGVFLVLAIYFALMLFLGHGLNGEEEMTWSEAMTITADVATGESVVEYRNQLAHSSVLWASSWFIKTICWLAVPTIMAIVIGNLLVRYERVFLDRRLESSFRAYAKRRGMSNEEEDDMIAFIMPQYKEFTRK